MKRNKLFLQLRFNFQRGFFLTLALLILCSSHSFATEGEGDDEPQECLQNPPPRYTDPFHLERDEQSGGKNRKLGLNGKVMPDEKPQAKEETDEVAEDTYVDALSHVFMHSTTDVFVPLPGTELNLEVKRRHVPDVWSYKSGFTGSSGTIFITAQPKALPDNPFGVCWDAPSLVPHLLRTQSASTSGSTTEITERLILNDHTGDTVQLLRYEASGGEIKLMPKIVNPSGGESIGTIGKIGTDYQVEIKRKHGTIYRFTATSPVVLATGVSSANYYYRANSVEDRYGNKLLYYYATGNSSLVPDEIRVQYASGDPGPVLTIHKNSDGRVDQITDPKGNIIEYVYDSGGEGQLLEVKSHPSGTETASTHYTYVTHEGYYPVDVQTFARHYNLESIEDPNGKLYQFEYGPAGGLSAAPTRAYSITKATLPDGGITTFEQHMANWPVAGEVQPDGEIVYTDPTRVNTSVSPDGNATVFQFSDTIARDADYLDGDVHSATFAYYYQKMDITYYKGHTIVYSSETPAHTPGTGTTVFGGEHFEMNFAANLSPSKTTDFSGNETTFVYGDEFDLAIYYPEVATTAYAENLKTFFFQDPTTQTNALGGVKHFEYETKFRLMKKITDELGRVTEYDFDTLGNRIKETIREPEPSPGTPGDIVKQTEFEYEDSDFPGFMTKKIVKKISGAGDPSWVDDLVTEYVPDSQGRVWKESTDPDGSGSLPANVTETTYDDNNNKLTVKDPRGNITGFTYDGKNRLTKVTYPDTTFKEMAYDKRGNKIQETDENGNKTLTEYDAMNRVVTQARDMDNSGTINTGDLISEFTYDALGSKLTQKDPNGNVTTFTYDDLQRLIKTKDALNQETVFSYGTTTDPQNCGGSVFNVSGFKPTKVVDPRGLETVVTYDDLYRPTRKDVEIVSGQIARSQMTYDPVGNMTLEKIFRETNGTDDPVETEHDYDALNRKTASRMAAGTGEEVEVETLYTSTGLPYRTIDELDRETDTEYDLAGRPIYVVSPAVAWAGTVPSPSRAAGTGLACPVTQTVYDAAGNVASTINPLGKQWDFTYDVRNRKTKEEQPSVADASASGTPSSRPTVETEYDSGGRVIKITDARGNETESEYDRANRVVKVKAPSVAVSGGGTARPETLSSYDKNGNVLTLTDPNSHVTTNTYDALNRLLTSTDAEGIVVTNEYDQVGNRTAVIDGKSQRTEFTYDGLNRNLTIKDPANKVQTFEYNASFKTKRTDSLGHETEYVYDLRSRLVVVDYDSSATTINADRDYVYDLTGNLLAVSESGKGTKAEVAYTYDALRRQITETSGGLTHAYTYDLAGNRIGTVYGGTSRTLVSTYDSLNRLATMTEGSAVTTYGYDLNGNIAKLTLPNGDLTSKTYDALNRVSVIETKTAGTTLLSTYTQSYDLAGNMTKTEEDYASGGLTDRTVTNTYDDINRLIQEVIAVSGGSSTTTTYTFDDAHNRTQKVSGGVTTDYTYNSRNQLTEADDGTTVTTFTYDDNGNRATRVQGGNTDTYAYDFENRLITLDKSTTGGAGDYAYVYDYRTRRVERSETPSGGSATVTKVVFAGGTSCQELAVGGSSTPVVEYIRGSDYGGGVGGILYTLRAGTPSYTHYNNRGDVVAKTAANGSLTYEAQYEAYGKRTAEQGTTDDRQKANTKDEDPTGLLNEGFRYRDLETGTFITRDPLGFVDGPNMYAYVVQNPWTKFDPLGLATKKDHEEKIAQKSEKRGQVQQQRDDAAEKGKSTRALDKQLGKLDKDIQGHKDSIGQIEATAKYLKEVATQYGTQFDEASAANKLDDSWSSYKAIQPFRAMGITPNGIETGKDAAYVGLAVGATMTGVGVAAESGLVLQAAVSLEVSYPTVAALLGVGASGYYVAPQVSTTVSRWGRDGLRSGDWVMQGEATAWNYVKSGKWQPGMGNQFAPFNSGQSFQVPASTLRAAGAADGNRFADGPPASWIKSALGQKIYEP